MDDLQSTLAGTSFSYHQCLCFHTEHDFHPLANSHSIKYKILHPFPDLFIIQLY